MLYALIFIAGTAVGYTATMLWVSYNNFRLDKRELYRCNIETMYLVEKYNFEKVSNPDEKLSFLKY